MDQLGYISELYKQKTYYEPLSRVTNNVLGFFIKRRGTSAYQCFKSLKAKYNKHGRTIAYKNVFKRIQILFSHKLIEKVTNENYEDTKHGAIYYSLTPLGIFYMFENDLVEDKTIFLEYPRDELFSNFLYPYLNSKTIESLTDDFIIGNIITFLKKCCKRISGYYWTRIKEIRKGNFPYWLGGEDSKRNSKVKETSFRSKGFIKQLRDRLDIPWINEETSKIEIIEKKKKIKIVDGKRILTLNIYIERLEVLLNDDGNNFFKLKLKKLTRNSFELEKYRSITSVELLSPLYYSVDSEMIGILGELISSILEYNLWHPFDHKENEKRSNDIRVLKRDKQFVNVVNSFKIQTERHFEEFSKKIGIESYDSSLDSFL